MIEEGEKLRRTTSSIITEDKGEFLGLPGGSIFAVLGSFAVIQAMTKNFFLALIFAGVLYFIMRSWLRGKPSHYIFYWIWERRAPKLYRHRGDGPRFRQW
ncbi:MAG: hypothetical protein PW734_01035 [Verrucomicrobium sp.]|nr:hypothetical protein [Verrucomicrobium sp.]